jgi:hypothetical protein
MPKIFPAPTYDLVLADGMERVIGLGGIFFNDPGDGFISRGPS